MPRFKITGGIPLQGTVEIGGRKNVALKVIAASMLTTGTVTLHRVPMIGDVLVMLDIMRALGASVTVTGSTVTISTAQVTTSEIPYDLGRKLRASLVLVGPLLARFKTVRFPHPGGCVIGKRSIRPHLDAMVALGAEVSFDGTYYTIAAPALHAAEVYLRERSVTATENLMMAACGASGTTTLVNCAEEDHVVQLADMITELGYQVSGAGSGVISITSNTLSSKDVTLTLIADEIEVGTFAVAALITHGTVTLTNTGNRRSLMPLLAKLDDFNANYRFDDVDESLTLLPSPDLQAADVQINPWPGFFPDLQSPFVVLATQAHGSSLIHDWMYDGRLRFVDQLERMGAQVTVCDPHRVVVTGPTPLSRASNVANDLRAGAALLIAALAAEGTSDLEKIELIDRGYANLDERLRALGAIIEREDN